MNVGFIGLGIMGAPMASNILQRGHRLIVYNRAPGKGRTLSDSGAILVSSPQDIVDVDVLITVVADDQAEIAVLFESGLIDRLPKDCVHVSSTTLGIDTAQKLAAAHAKHGRI